MKFRHAAALALVGWYLIAPPIRDLDTKEPYLDLHASYRDWKILHEFKTADDCDAGQRRATEDAKAGNLTSFDGGFAGVLDLDPQPWLDQQIEAECIASDDPRLKENADVKKAKAAQRN